MTLTLGAAFQLKNEASAANVQVHTVLKQTFHGGANAPDAKSYFGGEPVLDPFTGAPLLYQGGEPVLDLFTRQPLLGPTQVPVAHKAGDPVLHFAGDPVVHQNGDNVRFLGGEQIVDENGHPVTNGDGSAFLALPGQGAIHNCRQPIYQVIDQTGTAVDVGTAYTPLTVSLNALTAGTTVNLGTLTLLPGDIISVTVFDAPELNAANPNGATAHGSNAFSLTGAQVQVVNSHRIALFPTAAINEAVIVKVVIQKAARHADGDFQFYFGDEPLTINKPVVDANNGLVLDAAGKMVLFVAATIVDSQGNPKFHRRGELVYRFDTTQKQWVPATYTAADPRLYLGNEPVLYVGGEAAYYTSADPIQANQTCHRVTLAEQPANPGTASAGNKVQSTTPGAGS